MDGPPGLKKYNLLDVTGRSDTKKELSVKHERKSAQTVPDRCSVYMQRCLLQAIQAENYIRISLAVLL